MAALADNIVALDNCFTWFSRPRAIKLSTRDIIVYGGISSVGIISAYSWDPTWQLHLQGSPRSTVVEVDDHDNPVFLELPSGRVLMGWSEHNGDSFCSVSTNVADIRAWGAEGTVSSGNSESYVNLFLMDDTARTIFWFYRRGTPLGPVRLRTSTESRLVADPTDWTDVGDVFSETGERPYFIGVKNGTNRVDFFVTNGHPLEVSPLTVNHGYVTSDSGGTLSWSKTDGTAVTGLPFAPSEFTQVFSGDGWIQDLASIGGNPVGIINTYESSHTVHKYHQCRVVAGSWVVNEICSGGTTATEDWLYTTGGETYSGGAAQIGNDINIVAVGREYGAGDFRIEKHTHTGTFGSGSWSKTSDVSGGTGTKNFRPVCLPGSATLIWCSGTYASYTSYNTYLRMDPAPDWRKAKEASPTWTAGYAPSGVQAYYLFHEGSGNPADLANARNGTIVGSPTWNAGDAGDFGPFMNGFTTSNYVQINALAAALNVTGYPIWVYVLYKTTSTGTTDQCSFALGNSADNDPLFTVLHNSTAATIVGGNWRDTAGTVAVATAANAASNDGEFHVIQSRKDGAADFRARFDGASHAVNTTNSTGAVTFDRGAIGALLRAAVALPFAGEVHAVVIGWGAEPDLRWMAMDLLRGQFAGTFDPDAGGSVTRSTLMLLGVG